MKQKKMRIVVFALAQMLAADLATAQSTTNQPPPFGKPSVSEMLTHMLSLTDAQRSQIQPYIDAVQPQLDAIHHQARQAEAALLKQIHAQIRPFLTTEQQTKLDALEILYAAGPPPGPPGGSN